jgi:cyclase
VLFTGDNVVNNAIPFMHQAEPYQWLESLRRLEELDIDSVVPGHGSVGDKTCIAAMSVTVQTWIDAVQCAIDKGMSLEEGLAGISLININEIPREHRDIMLFFYRLSISRLYQVLTE